MKLTARKISIFALLIVLLLSVSAFFGIISFKSAEAAGTVTVSGNNVFTATGDAKVLNSVASDTKNYSTFSFSSDEDSVSYRRNLAYNWFEEVKEGEGDNASSHVVNGMFNMEIGFKSTSFERFVITFESQQYNKTKDSKTKNYLIFFPAAGESVYAYVTDDAEDKTAEDIPSDKKTALNTERISIKFTEKLSGAYALTVSDKNGATVSGYTLENVGGNYSKSSTSSSSPVYPLIFNTEFKGDEEVNKGSLDVTFYSLNGQSFETTSSTSNTVTDDTAPVLCLTEEFNFFALNGELDVDYVVIDVLRSSPSSTVNYYVLTYEQYKDGNIKDYNDKKLFEKAEDDILLESDIDKYLPSASDLNGTKYNAYKEEGSLTADMLVKVYISLSDISSNGTTSDVYLDWYVPANSGYLVNVKDTDFIAVANDGLGITYNYGDEWQNIIDAYQAEVEKLAQNLSAGSSSYMYLPSAESLFAENSTAYTDMKLSIYYYHDSKQSNTNLASSNLSINITRQGKYIFTIYATDASGNNMYYMDGDEVKEFASSEVWNMFDDRGEDGLSDKLPWFEFDVSYTGVQFEEVPGMQSTAYVGSSYSSASFKINGITGSYTTAYKLYMFDRAAYTKDNGSISYADFIKKMDGLYESDRKYFTEIPVASTLIEDTEDYKKYHDYGWSGTSTTFTPQEANAFYYIRAEVTDTKYNTEPVTCSLAVVSSETAKTISGENNWIENNVASVVLLSVAGVAFIGIILILVIKPKDKGDIEEQYENAKKKEKKNK